MGGPPGGPGKVEGPSQRARRGRETLQEGWEQCGGPAGGLGGVGRPSQRDGRGRESREGLPTPPIPPG